MSRLNCLNEMGINKLASWIFDFCCGYGYKPLRIIRTFLFVVLINTLLFTLIEVQKIGFDFSSILLLNLILKNFCISFASLGGKIDFVINDGLVYWLSIIEYLIGVILFAILVNAIYLRYKD